MIARGCDAAIGIICELILRIFEKAHLNPSWILTGCVGMTVPTIVTKNAFSIEKFFAVFVDQEEL